MYNFINSGLYDGLFILQDKETRTLWNHITGEGLYGEHAGYHMPIANLLQMNVVQALAMDSTMQVAISDRPYNASGGRSMSSRWSPDNPNVTLMDGFVVTLGDEDVRLQRMDMGLGIWSGNTQRFYTVAALRSEGRFIVDEFDGKKIVVFLDPLTSTPAAHYIGREIEAKNIRIEGNKLLLGDGLRIESGQLYDEGDTLMSAQQPQQTFTRWYGFSLTFPNPDIYQ